MLRFEEILRAGVSFGVSRRFSWEEAVSRVRGALSFIITVVVISVVIWLIAAVVWLILRLIMPFLQPYLQLF
jgi:phage shock protein PspC (stress-responsive transcriptional regulator)